MIVLALKMRDEDHAKTAAALGPGGKSRHTRIKQSRQSIRLLLNPGRSRF